MEEELQIIEDEAYELVQNVVVFWKKAYFQHDQNEDENDEQLPNQIETHRPDSVSDQLTNAYLQDVDNRIGALLLDNSKNMIDDIQEDNTNESIKNSSQSLPSESAKEDEVVEDEQNLDTESNDDQYAEDSMKEKVSDDEEGAPVSEIIETTEIKDMEFDTDPSLEELNDSKTVANPKSQTPPETETMSVRSFNGNSDVSQPDLHTTDKTVTEDVCNWNFHTIKIAQNETKFVFKTTMSRPTNEKPVSPATASVWFSLQKLEVYQSNFRANGKWIIALRTITSHINLSIFLMKQII
jgi:hypothetical protein